MENGENQTKMETVRTPETPRTQRTPAVRRNLFSEFEDADSPACPTPEIDLNLYSPVPPESELRANNIAEETRGWKGLVKFLISCVMLCVSVIAGLYLVFPKNLEIKFTREFQILVMLILTCVVLLTILWRFYSNQGQTTVDSRQPVTSTTRRPIHPNPASPADFTYLPPGAPIGNSVSISIKRTFKGDGSVIWSEFIRYFENVANLNQWPEQRTRRILLTTLRDQAEAYAYGLPETILQDYRALKNALNERFGHTALKESYIAEAKLRRKQVKETFRDFGQAIQDLFRRAYPENREYVIESSLKTFLDNCSDSDDFRLAVKRTRPKTLDEAVTAAMQEECIRSTETKKGHIRRDYQQVYTVDDKHYNGDRASAKNADQEPKRCYKCNSPQHVMRNCPVKTSRLPDKNANYKFNRSGTGNGKYPGNGVQWLNQNRPRQ